MSWSYGEVGGKEVGYGVPDVCGDPDCGEAIDRGLAYVCGGEHGGGDHGCGHYFCYKHLYMSRSRGQLCCYCAGVSP